MTRDDQTDRSRTLTMAHADVFTAVVLFVLALAMLWGGYTMDRLEIRRIHPASIPGLVPMALGVALAICSVILFVGAAKAGGLTRAGLSLRAPETRAATGRLALCLALTLVYPLVLVGSMPFWLATAIFVTVFIAAFEWHHRSPARHLIALATALLQGALVGLVTAYVFQEFFLVRLP
ncbi:tripartite tricarboxylate transporter TctB family protein [Acuticoccus sp. M5D2P5]|uniref:tripartite tricarboxylate transporter TctB family protein n=1 Tax=Acuticoccus kalidii TaxID=2910977 RepID=UPI001F3B5787|nr:tripartite tricarboxylate transporter TctB family protein [Acuticoccus kalidii]MCF3936128.1 tripartite tricarboxylate transporter TctB family protein [Acuticoccus kalidii]